MNVLSINFNHDGAGVILSDGRPAAFVMTERFSRKRKHPGLRACDLHELLAQASLALADIRHVILCNLHTMDSLDIPYTHGTSLKETWLDFELDSAKNFVTIDGHEIPCTVNPDHHMLHCAAAYYTSPFESAVAFSVDPVGCAAWMGRGHRLTKVQGVRRNLSASLAYSLVSAELFGTALFGAGKLMGLAPYGRTAEDATDYRSLSTMDQLLAVSNHDPVLYREDGRVLNASTAYHVQRGLEVQMSDALQALHVRTASLGVEPNVCLSGGAALNSVANQVAFEASPFSRLHLHPACGDDGTAIGAALWYWHDQLGHVKRPYSNAELMYSRRTYEADVDRALDAQRHQLSVQVRRDYCEAAATLLGEGKVVGWYQGASEIGPRALGNRSILADPRRSDMKDRLNGQVKKRESFRPFAPSVLQEHAEDWFGLPDSPFMLRVCDVRHGGVPAITHVDGTARVQTVAGNDNPAFHELISCFFRQTGVPLVLNTSFNIGGEPIVETPADAIGSFLRSGLDCLVFPERIVHRQPSA